MDLLTMNEALLVGGLVTLALLIALLFGAARRHKKKDDPGASA